MKLHLGCGENILEGYINIDLYPKQPGVIKADMGNLEQFEDNTVDEILSIHSLEHISSRKVISTLQEWKRVLKPSGLIIIVVPDTEKCFQMWLKDSDPFGWWTNTIWGLQTDEGQYHKFGFRRQTVGKIAEKAGLKLISVKLGYSHGGPDLLIKLTK